MTTHKDLMKQSYALIIVFVLCFIHKYGETAKIFNQNELKSDPEFNGINSTSSSLNEEIVTTLRFKRSGGFPKIPVQEKSSYFTSKDCGTRVVHFDPLRKGKIVGGTSVIFFLNLGWFFHYISYFYT